MVADNTPGLSIAQGRAGRPDDPPRSLADSMARSNLRNPPWSVLTLRERFEAEHPEVSILRPNESKSGLWEAIWSGGSVGASATEEPEERREGWDSCLDLLRYLYVHFPDSKPEGWDQWWANRATP
jgi:hypothetical protein